MFDSPMLLLVAKITLLLGAALAASRLLGRSASRHHLMWSAAFVAVLLLPVLSATLPRLALPVRVAAPDAVGPQVQTSAPRAELQAASHETFTLANTAVTDDNAPSSRAFPLPSPRLSIAALWLAGCMIALASLLMSHARVVRLRKASRVLRNAGWNDSAARLSRQLGLTRPVDLFVTDRVSTPMAGGIIHPAVFVPADADEWSDEQRDLVLAHELAHLANGDPLRQLVSRIAFTIYWFHPFAWLATRRANAACEQACDEAVLSLGVRPSTYAQVLLDFAHTADAAQPVAALPIVRGTLLETRLMAILNHSARPSRGRAAIPALGAIALTMVLAAAAPVQVVPPVPPAPPAPSVPVARAPRNLASAPARIPAPGAPVESAPVTPATPSTAIAQLTEPAPVPPGLPVLLESPVPPQSTDCWSDRRGNFSGSTSISSRNGETVVYQMIGRRGNDRVVQKMYGNLRVCGVAEGLGRENDDVTPSEWLNRASYVLLETREGRDVRRMEINGNRTTYTVNGDDRDVNAAAREWRDDLLALMDATWELSQLHGQESSLRGQISSIEGRRSSLQGQISSLQGQVSSMRGQISSMQGQESSLRGQISSIQGHVSSLQGAISSERGAISSLRSQRYDREGRDRDRIDDRIREHEDRIREIEREIDRYDAPRRVREVERRISELNNDGYEASMERRIRDFDLEGKTREIQRQIDRLDVEGQRRGIEREIDRLDVPRRSRDLEAKEDSALRRLRDRMR
jgi:beta-lactamase regulating signal transducer with metallopeptidase domain